MYKYAEASNYVECTFCNIFTGFGASSVYVYILTDMVVLKLKFFNKSKNNKNQSLSHVGKWTTFTIRI